MSNNVVDVLIIGAGPAGLTAGYLLVREPNVRIHLLEENPQYVGGISRTEGRNGYLFDIGGHRFFSKSKEVEDFWREILPQDFLQRPRSSRILYNGQFYSYPLRAFEALSNLGLLESALCGFSYIIARMLPVKNPHSFHEWVANQFGERLFRIFFKTYTEKVWGMSCDEISADWAAQRIKGLNLFTAILSSLKKSLGIGKRHPKGGEIIKTLIETFRYPRKGPGMMWETVANRIIEQGGGITMGMRAHAFIWDENRKYWTVKAIDPLGVEHSFCGRHVISSAPLRSVVSSVVPTPTCAPASRSLKYRDFLTVAIMLNTPPIFKDNWIYIHDNTVKVGRVQNYSSWSPEMVPDKDKGCLGLEYFCFEGDGLWSSTDDQLIELAIKELTTLRLAMPDQIIDGCVVRQPKAYPVYDDQYKDIVNAVRYEFTERYPTMHFVGRNGMHKYNNQDHAMMTAMLTVRNILEGKVKYDVWNVNEDAEYHEAGTAGEQQALKSIRLIPMPVRAES